MRPSIFFSRSAAACTFSAASTSVKAAASSMPPSLNSSSASAEREDDAPEDMVTSTKTFDYSWQLVFDYSIAEALVFRHRRCDS
jgi:hypothetical protein